MNDFVKRARKTAPSRHPVRDAVGECLSDIRDGRDNGLSWESIYIQLKRDGKAVGKGPSSLRTAMRYWEGLDASAPSGGASEGTPSAIRAQIDRSEQVDADRFGAVVPSTSRASGNQLGSAISGSIEDDDEDFKVRRALRD